MSKEVKEKAPNTEEQPDVTIFHIGIVVSFFGIIGAVLYMYLK